MSSEPPANLPFIIQASGQFTPDQVVVTYEPMPRPTTPDLENSIAAIWEEQTTRAKTDGRLLFNGEMLRYLRHHVAAGAPDVAACAPAGRGGREAPDAAAGALTGRSTRANTEREINPKSRSETKIPRAPGQNPKFILSVGPTNYRDFVGTNLYNRHRVEEIGWEKFSNPIGTTGTILTADLQICYGRRSPKVAWHANHIHTFGGALELADMSPDGTVDTFASLRRELHEELALTPADIEQIICIGLIRDREIHQPELLFDVHVRLTAAQVEQRWQTAESRDEHSAIVSLLDTPAAIQSFIQSHALIAPVAIGALHLHPRRVFDSAGA